MYLYTLMIFFKLLPESRFFGLKNFLLRLAGIKIGKTTRICSSVIFHTPNIEIGEGVWIGPGTRFLVAEDSKVFIGNNVDIAMECLFVTGSHEIGSYDRRAGSAIRNDIYIKNGVWIGGRSFILGGADIGEGSILGANSMCNKVLPSNCLYVGSPARCVRDLN